MWHLVWLSKCSLRAKLLPQTVQLYGLSVACLFIWRSSEGAFAKTWKQTVQVNMDPPKWHLPWRVKSFAFENALPHTWNRHKFNINLYIRILHRSLLHAQVQRFAYLTRKRFPLGMISAMHNELITKLKDLSAYLASVTANWYRRCAWTGSCLTVTRFYIKFVQWDLLYDWSTVLYRGNCLRRNSATH